MTGPPGCGKTVYSLHRLEQSLRSPFEGRGVAGCYTVDLPPWAWRVRATDLLEANHQFTMGKLIPVWDGATKAEVLQTAPPPPVTRQRIETAEGAGATPFLLVEELDKVGKLSDAKYNFLLGLFDAVYEAEGEIVVTASCSAAELYEIVRGDEVWRRLRNHGMENEGIVWDLHKYRRP